VTEKKQPPLPADDEEARFDDEGSAVGRPEPIEDEQPKQRTKTGVEIPVPKRADVARDLEKLVSDAKPLPNRSGRDDDESSKS
jgi:hypothetical protein